MLEQDKKELARGYYEKAVDELNLVRFCEKSGKYNLLISRMYYYIFNLCRTIMVLEDEDTKSHKTLMGNFNRIMIHERGIFDKSYGSLLTTLEKQRGLCDYEANYRIDKDFALYLAEQGETMGEDLSQYITARIN